MTFVKKMQDLDCTDLGKIWLGYQFNYLEIKLK
ncbi:hypothetical protein F480_04025 [Bibersteinia trehalosi Y31]|uniref:Uncharacterized protein n=1 Tax=Bibersteinia trehalosi Y31 TaxID=1261658 RepID=A0A179D103_BIBTR|nr:hypothetical protein F480_04025 [Bibersteinia trehalosi Y31]